MLNQRADRDGAMYDTTGRELVAIYCRVSSEEQAHSGTIQNQVDYIKRHCEALQIPITDFYLDDGVSGTVPLQDRREGNRLLRDAQDRRFAAVLVYKLDRLGRSIRRILEAVDQLEKLDIQVKSVTEPFDPSTSVGRFQLNMFSSFAELERENILERSAQGTNRLAREGAWLGGIVPYGYHKVGKGREARIVVSDEPLPGMELSEADVVRMMYRLTVDEHWSCQEIAEYLNALGVPPSYAKDARGTLHGKRRQATAGIWRAGRVLNMLKSTTYKGVHVYGKRSKRQRETIERSVPAIVDGATWDRAQEIIHGHFLSATRNGRRKYLLRGLIKCGSCGLTYIGTHYKTKKAEHPYYVCNGKQNGKGIYGARGKRCPSKSVTGALEDIVWADIEAFVRNPGPVLEKLHEQRQTQSNDEEAPRAEAEMLEQAARGKANERDRILDLYRRGLIRTEDLERQLGKIGNEEKELRAQAAKLRQRVVAAESVVRQMASTEDLLRQLNERMDGPPTWETKRELVEALVGGIKVDTIDEDGKKRAKVTVTYRFAPIVSCTGRGSWPR